LLDLAIFFTLLILGFQFISHMSTPYIDLSLVIKDSTVLVGTRDVFDLVSFEVLDIGGGDNIFGGVEVTEVLKVAPELQLIVRS